MESQIKETRGRKPIYDFSPLSEAGSLLKYTDTSTQSLLACAQRYAKVRDLDWKFRCYTEGEYCVIVRKA